MRPLSVNRNTHERARCLRIKTTAVRVMARRHLFRDPQYAEPTQLSSCQVALPAHKPTSLLILREEIVQDVNGSRKHIVNHTRLRNQRSTGHLRKISECPGSLHWRKVKASARKRVTVRHPNDRSLDRLLSLLCPNRRLARSGQVGHETCQASQSFV